MVTGLETFKTFFADFKDCYVLIGGSACDLYFTEQDIPFRVTHDLDMILCVEALTPAFFSRFWQFVHEGGYQHRQKADSSAPATRPPARSTRMAMETPQTTFRLACRSIFVRGH